MPLHVPSPTLHECFLSLRNFILATTLQKYDGLGRVDPTLTEVFSLKQSIAARKVCQLWQL